ncbi:MAG: hypothetical protein JRH18_25560 [Deltaproteobacteria bacterium]|nr:hypothetical protein [Deltaproteobacteria bacterium]
MLEKRKKFFTGMVCFQLMLSVIICWGLSVNRVEAAGSAGNTPASIIIRARAEITEQRIYVRDILSACTDNILKHRIEKLLLGPAPPPGREKILKGPWIESRIRSQSWMPKTAVISVPEKVRVVRAHQRLRQFQNQALQGQGNRFVSPGSGDPQHFETLQ